RAYLTRPPDGGANLLMPGAQTLTTTDNATSALSNLAGLTGTDGFYALPLTAAGAGIVDAAGNLLATDASDSFRVDVTPPTVDVMDVTPSLRNIPVDMITIGFSEHVTGFDLADLSLTRDGAPVSLST